MLVNLKEILAIAEERKCAVGVSDPFSEGTSRPQAFKPDQVPMLTMQFG